MGTPIAQVAPRRLAGALTFYASFNQRKRRKGKFIGFLRASFKKGPNSGLEYRPLIWLRLGSLMADEQWNTGFVAAIDGHINGVLSGDLEL